MIELDKLADSLATAYKSKLKDSIASGQLYNFTHDVEVNNNTYTIVFNLPEYWKYVEDGRKSGKYPPLEAIKQWINIKPILPRPLANGKLPTTNQLAFLIGRKIATKGIPAKNYLKDTLKENNTLIESTLASISANIINQIFKDLNNEIQ